MSAIDEHVGREVHTLMWQRRMSNRAVASALGIDPSTLGRKLRGSRDWSLAEILAVADILNVAVTDLLPQPRSWAPRGSNPESTGYRVRLGVAA